MNKINTSSLLKRLSSEYTGADSESDSEIEENQVEEQAEE